MATKMKATPKKQPVRIEIGSNLADTLVLVFYLGLTAFLFWLMANS